MLAFCPTNIIQLTRNAGRKPITSWGGYRFKERALLLATQISFPSDCPRGVGKDVSKAMQKSFRLSVNAVSRLHRMKSVDKKY